jgi:putative sterol carrier protein
LAKFFSDEYFNQLQGILSADQKWVDSTKGVKTSIAFNATDIGQNFILSVDGGVSAIQKVTPGTPAEFAFEGTYESWAKVTKGGGDLQSAVLKGQLKFKGSITKILMYRDRFMRVADLMKQMPTEF